MIHISRELDQLEKKAKKEEKIKEEQEGEEPERQMMKLEMKIETYQGTTKGNLNQAKSPLSPVSTEAPGRPTSKK